MNIGWRDVRTSRTVSLRLCGHVSGAPSGVFDQLKARVNAPISPPAAKKSLVISPPICPTPDAGQAYDRHSELQLLRTTDGSGTSRGMRAQKAKIWCTIT